MPVYNITVEKRMESGPFALRQWSNVYHVNAASIVAADGYADDLAAIERAIYPDNVAIVRLATHGAPGTGSGFSRNVFLLGTRGTGTPATQLPLFNTVLVQLRPSLGRPSPKYLRLPLDEAEVTSGNIVAPLTTDLNADYLTPLLAYSHLCDEHGQAFTGGQVNVPVQMRQLGWHRRTRAGFHRGWVAD